MAPVVTVTSPSSSTVQATRAIFVALISPVSDFHYLTAPSLVVGRVVELSLARAMLRIRPRLLKTSVWAKTPALSMGRPFCSTWNPAILGAMCGHSMALDNAADALRRRRLRSVYRSRRRRANRTLAPGRYPPRKLPCKRKPSLRRSLCPFRRPTPRV